MNELDGDVLGVRTGRSVAEDHQSAAEVEANRHGVARNGDRRCIIRQLIKGWHAPLEEFFGGGGSGWWPGHAAHLPPWLAVRVAHVTIGGAVTRGQVTPSRRVTWILPTGWFDVTVFVGQPEPVR